MYVLQYGDFPDRMQLFETEVQLPEPPAKKSLILNYNRPTSNQRWVREELPPFWTNDYLIREGRLGHGNDLNWWKKKATPEMVRYVEEQWDKRTNGIWLYINGKPVWITGLHYFYMQWYQLDDGPPDYRDRDRRFFYVWNHVENDPNSFGMVYLKHRRDGASFRGGNILLEHGSRTVNAHDGFQNKVGKDAAQKFNEICVTPLDRMPAFFKPTRAGTNRAAKGLEFKAPVKRMTSSNLGSLALEEEVLNTTIDFQNTVANAYDGMKLQRYMIDEAGKMVEANVMDMWGIVKKALTMRGQQPGKAFICSTLLEDQELESSIKAVENFQTLWEQSDPSHKMPDGKTVSGLTRYFCHAADGLQYETTSFFNEFGESKFEEAHDFLVAKRDYLRQRNHMRSLNMEIRQFPFTPEEAFRPSAGTSALDHERIIDCLAHLESNDIHGKPNWMSYMAEGELVWTEGFGTAVRFIHKKGGRFRINLSVLDKIGPNRVRRENYGYGSVFVPLNSDKFVIGVDPIEHNKDDLSSGTFSMAAACGIWKFDPALERGKPDEEQDPEFGKHWESYSFALTYLARPQKADEFYEDMVKACHLFGCKAMIETNKPNILRFFEQHGYKQMLAAKPISMYTSRNNNTTGNYATELMHSTAFEKYQKFVVDHCYPHRIPDPRLLQQLLKFDYTNHTRLDLYCAGEQALLGADPYSRPKQTESIKFELPTYKIKGNRSVLK